MEPGGASPTPLKLKRRSSGETFALDPSLQLGAGGEARIYAVPGDLGLAVKLYRKPTRERERKLALMIAKPPAGLSKEEPSLAWPFEIVDEVGGGFAGFVMPRVMGQHRAFELYNPAVRKRRLPAFDWGYLHRAARNLAAVAASLHEAGYIIGDINESNVLIAPTARVTILDTDSFRVPDHETGQVYFCPVAKPEFTSPELQGKSFKETDQTLEDDLFGLATMLFLLLMEGTHPFAGEYAGAGEAPMFGERIARGHFPYARRTSGPFRPRRLAPPIEILDPRVRELFVKCFEDGHADPSARPSAVELRDAVGKAEASLRHCVLNERHRFGDHLARCPWCERARLLGGRDPFPARGVAVAEEVVPVVETAGVADPAIPRTPWLEVKRLQTVIAAHPACVAERAELATLLIRRGRKDEAEELLERAAEAFAKGPREPADFRTLLKAARTVGGGEALSQVLRRTDLKRHEVPAVLDLGPPSSLELSASILRLVEHRVADWSPVDAPPGEEKVRLERPAWPSSVVATIVSVYLLLLIVALGRGHGPEQGRAMLVFAAIFLHGYYGRALAPFRSLACLRLLGRLRRSLAAALPVSGPVLVSGLARAVGSPVRSQLMQAPCALWKTTVERDLGGDAGWKVAFEGVSNQCLEVEDPTGRVRVMPDRAEVHLPAKVFVKKTLFASKPVDDVTGGPAPESAWVSAQLLACTARGIRAKEWRLDEGEPVTVVGWAETVAGQPTTIRARGEVPLLIMRDEEERMGVYKARWGGFLALSVALLGAAFAAAVIR